MRNEIHESGFGKLKSPAVGERLGGRVGDALTAPAVDEALADDAMLAETPLVAQRGSRRELPGMATEIERRIIDHPHAPAPTRPESPGDGALLRQLAHQLSSLQAQQDQIRRLLEQAERHAASKG